MTLPVRIARMLLAALAVLSLVGLSPAPAIPNPQPACCCQAENLCQDHAPQSRCACPACPVTLHSQPRALVQEKTPALPEPSAAPRWNPQDERAAQRRAAPPVPPPRIPA